MTRSKPHVSVVVRPSLLDAIMLEPERERLAELADAKYQRSEKPDDAELAELVADADAFVYSWGSPKLDEKLLAMALRLKMVAYAAGTVKPYVTDAFWARGAIITSASPTIAIDVAQLALAWILCSLKRAWHHSLLIRAKGWGYHVPATDIEGTTVGLVGASHVGREVIRLLLPFDIRVLLYDPYLTEAGAQELGAEKTDLDALMAQSDVVSLHAPSIPATRHMIGAEQLSRMKDHATLINTARGSLIDEAALIAELKTGRIWACLDVTDPEPPPPDSELYRLDHLIMTPHIAGCVGQMRSRLGATAVEELRRFFAGEPQLCRITPDMLPRIG